MVPEAENVSNEINETAQDFEKSGESSGFHDLSHDDMDIEKGPVQSLDDFLVDLPIQEEENPSKNLDELESPTKSSSSSSSSSATVEPSAAASSKSDGAEIICNDLDNFQGDKNQNFGFQIPRLWSDVKCTVWKCYNFSVSQSLCEINFQDTKSAQYAILTLLKALHFDIFYEFLQFKIDFT